MIGEIDLHRMFFESSDYLDEPRFTSYLVFIIFLIIMSIILMNLLIGLAVDDVNLLRERANSEVQGLIVNLALDLEVSQRLKAIYKIFQRVFCQYFKGKNRNIKINGETSEMTQLLPKEEAESIQDARKIRIRKVRTFSCWEVICQVKSKNYDMRNLSMILMGKILKSNSEIEDNQSKCLKFQQKRQKTDEKNYIQLEMNSLRNKVFMMEKMIKFEKQVRFNNKKESSKKIEFL